MKSSRFNVPIGAIGQDEIIYNTLTGAIARVSPRLLDVLKSDPNRITSNHLLNGLKEIGLIIEDGFSELAYYRELHERWKRGKELVNFNVLLTYDCNFECPYCYQGRGEKGQQIHGFKYMDKALFESVKKFIKRTAAERGAKKLELVLYGGEPFLVPDMAKELTDEIAEWCQTQGMDFNLHALSNGVLISEDIVSWLSHYKCRLQIPVDGAKEIHDKHRFYKDSKKGSYEDITRVLGLTKNTNIETHIRISLTDETYPTMENLLDDLKDRGLTHVYPDFCYITAFTEACTDFGEHCLPDTKLFKILPELWEKAHEKGFPLDIRPQVQPLPCSSIADGSFIVDPFGEVYKCWELVGLKEHVVGRINADGSMTKTKVYGNVLQRNPLEIERCKNHAFLPACAGGCVCKAYWQNGTYCAAGCGTELYLLKDKVRVYLKTIDSRNTKTIESGDLRLEIIEGKQAPRMSHCYVLV